jgi:hypothetical protein
LAVDNKYNNKHKALNMSQQNIDIGSAPSSGDGDPLRVAFTKINENFTELYSNVGNLTNSVTSVAGRTGNVQLTVNDIIGFNNYQYANIAYVDNAINNLINSAPETLDTLNELAAALNNDANFASNVINTINQIVETTEEFEYINLTGRLGFAANAVTFIKPAYTDIGDEIDANLTITRAYGEFIDGEWIGGGGAIYNSALEETYDEFTSPAGTLWNADGWDNLDTVQSRYYSSFKSALRNSVGANVVDAELVMWDTANNKYYTVQFSSWAVGPSVSGAFTYTRRLIDTTESVGIVFADGTNIVTAPREYWDEPQTFVGGTNTYVLRLEDRGHHVYASGSSIQVPSNLQLAFPIGTVIRIISNGSAVTIIPCECISPSIIYRNGYEESGNAWIISAYSSSTLTKVAENTWRLTSDDASISNSNVTYSSVVSGTITTDELISPEATPLYIHHYGDDGNGTNAGEIDVNSDSIVLFSQWTNNVSTEVRWEFNSDAEIIFPDNTVQTTAYTGGRIVNAPLSSTGATGDLAGDIAYDESYIYRCIENFGGPAPVPVTTLASSGNYAYIDATDYTGNLMADFDENPIGWTYNNISITSVVENDTFGDGYQIGAASSFNVINGVNYNLQEPGIVDIWKRVAWSIDTW